jgi:hypothetical protein
MEVAPSAAAVAIVAVPFPAQGHLNQMLHLSLLAQLPPAIYLGHLSVRL